MPTARGCAEFRIIVLGTPHRAWVIGAGNLSLANGPAMPPSPQKTALVTGAARGIGLATAKRFLAEGWRVALLDIEGELLHGAVAGLADPDNTLGLHCDVSDAKAVAAAMASVSARF